MGVNKSKKVYWQGLEQLSNDPEFVKNAAKEFPEYLPIKDSYGDNSLEESEEGSNRRDFLKLMGFSVAAVSLAACEAPVRKAIPYLNKPESIDPGIPNYYASSYVEGGDYCAVVVKTREGRPIFLEGNTFSSVSKGGTNARVQASVLSLYDNEKDKEAKKDGSPTTWDSLDKEIQEKLAQISDAGGQIRIVSNTIVSPSTKKIIADFTAKYPTTKHVSYDSESRSGIMAANKQVFGQAVIPSYDFGKANVIVGISADFLGNWLSGIEFTAQYSANRKVDKKAKKMSQHFQFETNLSITGAAADYRTPIKPSQEGLVVAALYNAVAKQVGGTALNVKGVNVPNIDRAAKALASNKGKSLVVSGSNDVNVQALVNGINVMLENYEATIDLDTPCFMKQGDDNAMADFITDVKSGKVEATIFYNANPVYDHPKGKELGEAISKLKLSVSTADRLNETASLCGYNAPDSHFLESWGDAEPKNGFFSVMQPTIRTIFKTRQVQDSLLKWSGSDVKYSDYLKSYWEEKMFSQQQKELFFSNFWTRSLHDGVFEPTILDSYTSEHQVGMEDTSSDISFDYNSLSSAISANYKADNSALELIIYSNPVMGSGADANNPILQETPEPISRVCWGNYVSIPQSMATELGFSVFETETDVAKVTINGQDYELPVVAQPGQAKGTISIALGYGREKAGKVAAQAGGLNAFRLLNTTNGIGYAQTDVKLVSTGTKKHLAQTQTHHTIMGRDTIIKEFTLGDYKSGAWKDGFRTTMLMDGEEVSPRDLTLWDVSGDGYPTDEKKDKDESLWVNKSGDTSDRHPYVNHQWGLTIDLNACTGCAACVVACHLENNVPVVGKKEVIKRREMHWLRIDRYYSNPSEDDLSAEQKGLKDHQKLELSADNPEVVFQPMMCQHCNNAPCEAVCPVAATTHSSEGLNQMTYNRCVGTKYCANNCPYKVRRFNWFKYHNNNEYDYHLNNDLGKMVLNPDVTVRSRGVMEKCSMCVQRLQAGKLKAKMEKRHLNDGDVSTACASACPADAIVIGDLNDTKSGIRQLMDEEIKGRAYNVLDEIGVKPNVYYLAKVRNKDTSEA